MPLSRTQQILRCVKKKITQYMYNVLNYFVKGMSMLLRKIKNNKAVVFSIEIIFFVPMLLFIFMFTVQFCTYYEWKAIASDIETAVGEVLSARINNSSSDLLITNERITEAQKVALITAKNYISTIEGISVALVRRTDRACWGSKQHKDAAGSYKANPWYRHLKPLKYEKKDGTTAPYDPSKWIYTGSDESSLDNPETTWQAPLIKAPTPQITADGKKIAAALSENLAYCIMYTVDGVATILQRDTTAPYALKTPISSSTGTRAKFYIQDNNTNQYKYITIGYTKDTGESFGNIGLHPLHDPMDPVPNNIDNFTRVAIRFDLMPSNFKMAQQHNPYQWQNCDKTNANTAAMNTIADQYIPKKPNYTIFYLPAPNQATGGNACGISKYDSTITIDGASQIVVGIHLNYGNMLYGRSSSTTPVLNIMGYVLERIADTEITRTKAGAGRSVNIAQASTNRNTYWCVGNYINEDYDHGGTYKTCADRGATP